MSDVSGLFRERAVQHASQSERLDAMLQVTDLRGWIGLAGGFLVVAAIAVWSLFGSVPIKIAATGILVPTSGIESIVAENGGIVTEVPAIGAHVAARSVIATLRSGSRIIALRSARGGTVMTTLVARGSFVSPGTPVAAIAPERERVTATLFVPIAQGELVRPGMPVEISPDTFPRNAYGWLLGSVIRVNTFPAPFEHLAAIVPNRALIAQLTGNQAVVEVSASLQSNPNARSGLAWSTGTGPDAKVAAGTPCTASIVVSRVHPLQLLVR